MLEIVNRRYVVESAIGSGGMGKVYRAIDRLAPSDQRYVALKRVMTPSEALIFASQAKNTSAHIALAQEFQTLASFRHPYIVSVLDYGFEPTTDGKIRPFYTMELLDNAQPITEFAKGISFEERIQLLGQLLQALIYLHRRGILHRDLKPDNVLVQDGQVRVMDFGLAMTAKQAQESKEVSGTLAYLAPEILKGGSASIASDLYDVGLIAFEMLTGNFPYQRNSLQEFLANIALITPDVSQIDHEQVSHIIGRLVSKDPAERHDSALEVLEALESATQIQLTPQSEAIREAFLQASKLVGRDAEVTQLSDALRDAMVGRGSAWLVAGESGVGKTRLLSEIRTLALVRGALTLRGQAYVEGSVPYQVWRAPLRWLAISVDMSDEEASILKSIVTDIDTLLERPISEAQPSDDSKADQDRLLNTVVTLIKRFATQQPLVLILEDLHWVRPESLLLLDAVLPLVKTERLLVLGNFRNDETPHLPDQLPTMKLLSLRRLSVRFISELTQQILGPAGELPIVNALLYRETEGNVFFLVEVMRTLAEQVGDLGLIGIKTLPEQLFVGGIDEAVNRRLDRVNAIDNRLLAVASLIGRKIDLPLLTQLEPNQNIPDWIIRCSEFAILELLDGEWIFAHDKLREGSLKRLTAEEQCAEHGRIAQTIEAMHPDYANDVMTLAYHWQMAQNVEKEKVYSLQAGEMARTRYANSEALRYLQRALVLADDATAASVALKLGSVHELIGNVEEAQQYYTQAQEKALAHQDQQTVIDASLHLATLARQRGEPETSRHLLEGVLDKAEPTFKGQLLSVLASTYADQGQTQQALDYYEQAKRLLADNRAEKGNVLIGLGLLQMERGDNDQAMNTLHEGLEIAIEVGNERNIGRAVNNMAGVYIARGEYQNALACLLFRLNNALKIQDKRGIGTSVGNIGYALYWMNQYEFVERCYQLALRIVKALQFQQLVCGYTINLALLYEKYFLFAEALSKAEEANAIAQQGGFSDLLLQTQLMSARYRVLSGIDEPEEVIAELQGLIATNPDHLADIYYGLWRIDETRTEDQARAAEAFKKHYEATYQIEAALHYQELTGETLPPAPALPSVPSLVTRENLTIETLLDQAELQFPIE